MIRPNSKDGALMTSQPIRFTPEMEHEEADEAETGGR